MKRVLLCLLCVVMCVCVACAPDTAPQPTLPDDKEDAPVAEGVRAFWVPFMEVESMLSSGDPDMASAALKACLTDCADRGANTVFFHVRANSDAYYASDVYLENDVVKPLLQAGFNPLTFVVEEAHRLGMTLHAWVNPYRIGADTSFAVTTDTFSHGGKFYYVPSAAATSQLILDGMEELLSCYAVDGIHIDDYFYPEGAVPKEAPAVFEVADFEASGAASVADWRRSKVNALMASAYTLCHKYNRVFGISPAYDIEANYRQKYADMALWAQEGGYCDYLCPQLYFGFSHGSASYITMLDTWCSLKRAPDVRLYIGLALYKTGLFEDTYAGVGKTEWANGGDILARQVAAANQEDVDGIALYSHQSITALDGRDKAVAGRELDAVCQAW